MHIHKPTGADNYRKEKIFNISISLECFWIPRVSIFLFAPVLEFYVSVNLFIFYFNFLTYIFLTIFIHFKYLYFYSCLPILILCFLIGIFSCFYLINFHHLILVVVSMPFWVKFLYIYIYIYIYNCIFPSRYF